ncbi:CheR family methyltransferase [Scytonema sp. NUACC26]|uniref:CheR family methyltransferase n=1 Tax=Scytonema sp. NUACC26 TaxID=3140176 RepID=UPI0038B39D6E
MSSRPEQDDFEALLEYLRQKHNFDFTSYKHCSLMRQICYRMRQISIGSFREYIDYLEEHSEEVTHVINAFKISVTSFFRDKADWDCLSSQIIPEIIASKLPDEPIRVWSAGCASGQETYTLAMILAENLAIRQFLQRVRIYGTDISEKALNQAKQGIYPSHEVKNLPMSLLNRYFELVNNHYVFRRDLRRSIIFEERDIIHNTPIPRIDLLVCRNTLIYFSQEAQSRTFVRFYFSLKDNGFLFLGSSEMAPNLELFKTVNLRHRIFTKVPQAYFKPQLLVQAFKKI